jgi:hypothetical protein
MPRILVKKISDLQRQHANTWHAQPCRKKRYLCMQMKASCMIFNDR